MSEICCRLLRFTVADGPRNMAADEVLLESAGTGVASLRFYGWSKATLSLGYFQMEALRKRDPRLAELPFVRRPSGGATLVHHHELTYGLALPAAQPWQTADSWLCRMHTIIASALAERGVTTTPQAAASAPPFRGDLCFQHFAAGDLLISSAKVVGSAQRRQRGALMQHGSILLAQSPYTPALPGIRELSGRDFGAEEIAEAVQESFTRSTGWRLVPGGWTGAELDRIEHLAMAKYAQDHWNRKR
ncbi:MAG TPA: biotin/lipoate A/B protein ligase family protein [Gemmataceae bacterium]|nr:biotin/lipoate A/B protein ligase family protein [Gemmataceae bacterium]